MNELNEDLFLHSLDENLNEDQKTTLATAMNNNRNL